MSTAPEVLAVDATQLAEMLGLSLRHIRRMDSSGQIPRAVMLGRAKRWSVDIIRAWLMAGSPDRVTWERTQRGR